MAIDAELAEVLQADQGILDAFGMSVVSAEDGVCIIDCTVPASLVNAGGFAHGSRKKIAMLKAEGVQIKNNRVVNFEKRLYIPK